MILGGSSIEIKDFQEYSEITFALLDSRTMRICSVTGGVGSSEVLSKITFLFSKSCFINTGYLKINKEIKSCLCFNSNNGKLLLLFFFLPN